MRFDLDKLAEPIAYKLLAATVVPRPIAWVVTQSTDGQVNAAPYSFFNVMGSAPPTVALGLLADAERGFKDTATNIMATGEFVVHLVPEGLVEKMEAGELSLEDSLKTFEEGVKLTRECQQALVQAEQKVKVLIESQEGIAEQAFDLDD